MLPSRLELQRPARGFALAVALASLGALSATQVQAARIPSNDRFSVIYDFKGQPDGAYPWAGLVPGADGNLYGSTVAGGTIPGCFAGCGTLFRLDSSGKETQLASLQGDPASAFPYGPPVPTKNGVLYGVTNEGGNAYFCSQSTSQNCGTFFELEPDGTLKVLYNFGSKDGYSDALYPAGSLVRCGHNAFCGTSQFGGRTDNNGTVFQVSRSGKESVLYRFSNGSDGGGPGDSLARDSDDNLYGVTAHGGGSSNRGTVFKLAADGTYTVLYTFQGSTDGGNPVAGLVRDKQGNLYGTTGLDGDASCNCGVVFRLAPGGAETVLHTFTGGIDGALPFSQLTRDRKGNLFGTTWSGGGTSCGGHGCGTVFEILTDGSERVLHAFRGARDGAYPHGRVYIDSSDNLFGTTEQGGRADLCTNGCGVIYKISAQ